MAEKSTSTKPVDKTESIGNKDTATVVSEPMSTLPQRIHFKQFVAMHPELDDMQKAGFKAFCGGKTWMYESEWKEQLKKAYNI